MLQKEMRLIIISASFASIVDDDLAVWAARVALVARCCTWLFTSTSVTRMHADCLQRQPHKAQLVFVK